MPGRETLKDCWKDAGKKIHLEGKMLETAEDATSARDLAGRIRRAAEDAEWAAGIVAEVDEKEGRG